MKTFDVVLLLCGPMLFGLLAVWVCDWVRRKRIDSRMEREARQRARERAAVGTAAPRVPRPRWPYEPKLPKRGHVPPRPMPAPAAPSRSAVESGPAWTPTLHPGGAIELPPGVREAPVFTSGSGGDFGGGGASGSWESSSSDSSSSSSDSSSSSGGSE